MGLSFTVNRAMEHKEEWSGQVLVLVSSRVESYSKYTPVFGDRELASEIRYLRLQMHELGYKMRSIRQLSKFHPHYVPLCFNKGGWG